PGIDRGLSDCIGVGYLGACLYPGEAAEPGEVDVATLEGGHDCGIVVCGDVLDVEACGVLEVGGDRTELLFELRDLLVGDAADHDGRGAVIVVATGGKGEGEGSDESDGQAGCQATM